MIVHQKKIEYQWKVEDLPPFNELILSWNGKRPLNGDYLFYIRLKTHGWSDWLLYASWGQNGQSTFADITSDGTIQTFQDILNVMGDECATAFHINIVSKEDAPLSYITSLHVYINHDEHPEINMRARPGFSVYLDVPGSSQMHLNHPRNQDLCSPTSTAAVINFLLDHRRVDPIHFAQNVWDRGFDIFGNWVFNIAQASHEAGEKWSCWVERLKNFDEIYQKLADGIPVIVSVKGPLKRSASPYAIGHLIAVIGYDAIKNEVICMDPAFPSDDQTHVHYHFSDFVQAWSRKGKIAYVFEKKVS
ncbi:MAG: C39 family peptidase [Parachlamydiaceae bacterium]